MNDPARPGRLAGIDYGTVRIGIAVSDARQTLASPFENYSRRGAKADAEFFCRLRARNRSWSSSSVCRST